MRPARPRRLSLALVVLVAVGFGLSGCGGSQAKTKDADADPDKDATHGGPAADTTVCRADATAAPTPFDKDFPTAWTFPAQTTAYDVRTEAGATIVTAISQLPFETILHYLNTDEVAAGFTITDGETEEHDAEADWASTSQKGRWAIRESSTCPGETVIQVAAFTS